MKLLSFQPCSLYQNGGCGRLLRRLYDGHENDITSIYVSYDGIQYVGKIKEIKINVLPLQKKWMRWHLRKYFSYLRENCFFKLTANRLIKKANNIEFDILHIIDHGSFSSILLQDNLFQNTKLWVSFHDHYTLCSSYANTNLLWNLANRRFVISSELGEEYKKQFGSREFEIATDGVKDNELSNPKHATNDGKITIYFGGLLHIDYLPLFKILAEALDQIATDGTAIKLILRGTQDVSFLNKRRFNAEYRKSFVSDDEIKREIDSADILYLPIKFTSPEFYLYSLSTKMVGYVGASGSILYHGPQDSAANKLLSQYKAASICFSLKVDDMIKAILNIHNKKADYSINAKRLAKEKFSMSEIRKHFWNAIN